MANSLPEGLAQFEYQKMQLIGSLGAVAETMRNCAAIAEQFAQLVSHVPYSPTMLPNGQFAVPAAISSPAPAKGKRKAGDEGDGRKAKKIRKPKDPNAPKRPASSYLLFQNEIRQQLKAENPNWPNNELLGTIAKMWKAMPKEEKDAYEARQKLAKDQWLADKTAYNASKDTAVEIQNGAAPLVPDAPAEPKPTAAPVVSETSDDETSEDEESSSSSESSVEDKQPTPKKPKKKTAPVASSSKAPTTVTEKKAKPKA